MTATSWIAYVGPFTFPWGQAGSRRVYGVARALVDCGYRVIVGAGQPGPVGLSVDPECPDLMYEAIGEMPAATDSPLQKLYQSLLVSGRRTVVWLDAMPIRPNFVVAYGAGASFMRRIRAWCRVNNVPLIADVVEWYDGTHMLGGYFGPFHANSKLAMHYYYPGCDGVIAISDLLADHYRARGGRVIRIPPILDVKGLSFRPHMPRVDAYPIRLVYAGTPGRKDLLATIIKGIALADPEGKVFALDVLGPTKAQVEGLLGGEPVPDFVSVTGTMQQASIPETLQKADFSVLLREPLRFANAGFPTKFVESLANGVPVIANLTSDLHRYLHDGADGYVCVNSSAEALAATLSRVRTTSVNQRCQMREQARREAESSFDYRRYVQDLSSFLDEVRR